MPSIRARAMTLLDSLRLRAGARLASAVTGHGLTADALQSVINYGTADSKVNSARPEPAVVLTDTEEAELSTYGLGYRLTWGVAGDALSTAFHAETDSDLPDREGIDLRTTLRQVYAAARVHGGAHVMLVTDSATDLIEPLRPGTERIVALHVLTARDARPRGTYDDDPRSPTWTDPDAWLVQPVRRGVSVRAQTVHASRLVYVPGLPVLPSLQGVTKLGYDLSALAAYWPALRRLDLALESATLGAVELSTPWVKLKHSLGAPMGEDAPSVATRLEAYRATRSMARLGVLYGDDEAGRDNVTLTGLRTEVVMAAYEAISAIEGIPLTALLGMAPAGLSTDDASGRATYYRALDIIRADRLTPAIRAIYYAETGRQVDVSWDPLGEADAAESSALVSVGIADPDELRQRHGLAPRDVGAMAEPSEEEIAALEAELAAMVPEPTQRADADTYRVPEGARNNARKVLRWREEHGDDVKGMTSVGWRRARQLAESETVSREIVGKMAAFARHRKNAEVSEEYRDEPWRDAGYVAWLGWGGTTGVDWARGITGADEG